MRYPKPVPASEGGTPAERLDRAFRQVLALPKEAVLKAEAEEKRKRDEKKRAKKKH